MNEKITLERFVTVLQQCLTRYGDYVRSRPEEYDLTMYDEDWMEDFNAFIFKDLFGGSDDKQF